VGINPEPLAFSAAITAPPHAYGDGD